MPLKKYSRSKKFLNGVRFLITAGPTREYLDPVRFLSNPSTGKMGYALAAEAVRRGAKVTLVLGPVSVGATHASPLRIVHVVTALDMYRAVMREAPKFDVIIMAAAVSDYRPKKVYTQKVKKRPGPMTITLVRTPDILATLGKMNQVGARHASPLLVGFAAETNHVVAHAQEKLKKKNLDLIVANAVNQKNSGFASGFNQVWIMDRQGKIIKTPRLPKQKIARLIINMIERKLSKR